MTYIRQKFKQGDLVQIAADLGRTMRHFRSDEDAIILGSYRDQYGGDDIDSYSVIFCKDGEYCSWYHESQLTFVRHAGHDAIEDLREMNSKAAAERAEKYEVISGKHVDFIVPKGWTP